MKTTLKLTLFTCLVLIMCIPSFTACKQHEHTFGEWEIDQSPTCGEEGVKVRRCSCGALDNEAIPATNEHSWEDATRTTPKTCSVCRATEGDPLTAFQALNDDERKIYYALISYSARLKVPSSLKLIDLKVGKAGASATEDSIFVRISANNSFGVPVTETYVYNGSLTNAGSAWYSVAGAWPHIGSVSKINDAITEHFSD